MWREAAPPDVVENKVPRSKSGHCKRLPVRALSYPVIFRPRTDALDGARLGTPSPKVLQEIDSE